MLLLFIYIYICSSFRCEEPLLLCPLPALPDAGWFLDALRLFHVWVSGNIDLRTATVLFSKHRFLLWVSFLIIILFFQTGPLTARFIMRIRVYGASSRPWSAAPPGCSASSCCPFITPAGPVWACWCNFTRWWNNRVDQLLCPDDLLELFWDSGQIDLCPWDVYRDWSAETSHACPVSLSGFLICCMWALWRHLLVLWVNVFYCFLLEQIAFLGITTAERTTLILQQKRLRQPVSMRQNPFKWVQQHTNIVSSWDALHFRYWPIFIK